jgi:hypothetical protein
LAPPPEKARFKVPSVSNPNQSSRHPKKPAEEATQLRRGGLQI